MPLTLQHPAKCQDCGRVMRPGTEASWIAEGNGFSDIHAGACPSAEDARSAPVQPVQTRDPEDRFTIYKCDKCKNTTAVLKGVWRARCCYCGGDWREW